MKRRALLILTFLVTSVFLGAGAAHAADSGPFSHFWDVPGTNYSLFSGPDCTHPPVPHAPSTGVSGFIDPGPKNPVTGDPFVAAAQAAAAPAPPTVQGNAGVWQKPPPPPVARPTLYDVYGMAGTMINPYDPSGNIPATCLNGDTTAIAFTFVNQLGMGFMSVASALTIRAFRLILNPSFTSLFDPVQHLASVITGNGLLVPLAGVVVVLIGLYFMWKARQQNVGYVAEKASWALLILTAGAIGMSSIVIGVNADAALGKVITSASSMAVVDDGRHDPADALGGVLMTSVIYPTWALATFGSGDQNEAAAKEFGPALFRASAFTRTEEARINADPTLTGDLIGQKRQNYADTAEQIKAKYPIAYEFVRGDHPQEQAGFVLVGGVATFLAAGFLLLCLVRFGFAMIVVRVALGLLPAIALLTAFPTKQHLFRLVAGRVWTYIFEAALFGIATIIYITAVIGGILNPSVRLDPAARLIALVVVTWFLYREARKLKYLARESKLADQLRERLKGRTSSDATPPDAEAAPEPNYYMHAETHARPMAAPVVRAIGGTVRTAGMIGAAAATGGSAGAGFAAKAAATSTAKHVGVSTARQVGSGAARQISGRPGGQVIHSVSPGSRPPGPSRPAATRGGVAVIHSIKASGR